MKKEAIILLLCSSMIFLIGCHHTNENQPTTGQDTVTVTVALTNKAELTTIPKDNPTTNDNIAQNSPTTWVVSEENFLTALEMEYGYVVIKSEYDDFDNDGEYEMFAFVATPEYMELYDPLYGKVVFLNSQLKLTELSMDFYIWDDTSIRTVALKNRLLFVADEAFVSETASKVYAVYEKEPYCLLSGMGYFAEEDGKLLLNVSDYDMILEYDGMSLGHTWKNYYLYYDEENRCFNEYMAKEITEDEFLQWQGAELILSDIKNEYPGAKLQFLLRDNNMVHVNIAYDQGEYILQKNVTSELVDGMLINAIENDGKYQTNCFYAEEIATEQ